MTQTRQDFEMWSGDHKHIIFEVKGVDEDLTGAFVRWKLAESSVSEYLVRKVSDDSSEIELDGTKVIVKLEPEDTIDLTPQKKYYHELEIQDVGGSVSTAAVGKMKLKPTLIN